MSDGENASHPASLIALYGSIAEARVTMKLDKVVRNESNI